MPQKLTAAQIEESLETLNRDAVDPWTLQQGHLHRELRFDDFSRAFAFMTAVALHAEKLNHHPDWSNSYNRVHIDLVTHEVGGISALDFDLAQKIESLLE